MTNINLIETHTTSEISDSAIATHDYKVECKYVYESSDDNMVVSIESKTLQMEPRNATLQLGNANMVLLFDSGSVCTIVNESLATKVLRNSSLAPTTGSQQHLLQI